MYNAVRSSSRAKRFFRYPEETAEDVSFKLIELDRVPIGESFSVVVQLKVTETAGVTRTQSRC